MPERPADRFVRLACLSYGDDQTWDGAAAAQLLADHPELTRANLVAAAAAVDVAAIRELLAADPAAVRREDGPYGWEPLFALAAARPGPEVGEEPVVDAARILLGAGADPNVGCEWGGTTPFTAVTMAFGEGEGGPERQPRHPHGMALARVLLDAGADPHDAQALYNRMFGTDDDHLELLFEFGLGPTSPLLTHQLRWALQHGMAARVTLLADAGVDVTAPFRSGSTPTVVAATAGHPELVDLLVERGAARPELGPEEAFVAAALAGDAEAVSQASPDVVAAVRTARPGLVVWAAARGRPGAVRLLVGAGFDVNAKGRADAPREGKWETALHVAAMQGDAVAVSTYLELGADPTIRDHRFDATPAGWARHFGHDDLAGFLDRAAARG